MHQGVKSCRRRGGRGAGGGEEEEQEEEEQQQQEQEHVHHGVKSCEWGERCSVTTSEAGMVGNIEGDDIRVRIPHLWGYAMQMRFSVS